MTHDALDDLLADHPLPPGWSALERVEDAVTVDGMLLHRAGVASTSPRGEEVVGSAADFGSSPLRRAYFELVERICTIEALSDPGAKRELRTLGGEPRGTRSVRRLFPESEAPERWRYARSNGVALHVDFQQAAGRAFWELSERDRVLRAWYGEVAPRRIDRPFEASPLGASRAYEWSAYSFPHSRRSNFSAGVEVCGVFGAPIGDGPFVLGYGARPGESDALAAAEREAMQLLAFLWGEERHAGGPEFSPTPVYHLDTLQEPARRPVVRAWLDGAHVAYESAVREAPRAEVEVLFADLSPSWLRGLRVVKACCDEAAPLSFGDSPFVAHLPPQLRVHPIA